MTITRTSKRYLTITGATCGLQSRGGRCGGELQIQDHGGRGEWRYELFCGRCGTCDPNGHRTLEEVQEAVTAYFHGGEK